MISSSNYTILEGIINEAFKPTFEKMNILKGRILPLLNNLNTDICDNKSSKKEKIKSALPNSLRCHALIYDLEYNANSNLVPARCKRTIKNGSLFCKQHGSKNMKDSQYLGKDIIHEFKWERLGTIDAPTYIFEKSYEQLVKRFISKTEDPIYKTDKIPKEIKAKRVIANPFITFKSCNANSIKEDIVSSGLHISGKELIIEITKRASVIWASLNDEEHAKYKKQALINKYHNNPPKLLIDKYDDYIIKSNNIVEEEIDDYSTWVYNELLNVWVDTDNKLCYGSKDMHLPPVGQLNLNKVRYFSKNN